MKTPELKSGYWSVDYLNLLANGEATLSETSLRQCAEYIESAYKAIDLLESRLAQVERYAKEMAYNLDCSACTWCEYVDSDYASDACKECRTHNEGFKLRVVCPENTKEEGK